MISHCAETVGVHLSKLLAPIAVCLSLFGVAVFPAWANEFAEFPQNVKVAELREVVQRHYFVSVAAVLAAHSTISGAQVTAGEISIPALMRAEAQVSRLATAAATVGTTRQSMAPISGEQRRGPQASELVLNGSALLARLDRHSGFVTARRAQLEASVINQVLYLRPTRLTANTLRAVRQHLEKSRQLTRTGPTIIGIVLDLRDNAGGPLIASVAFADLFLSEGTLASSWRRGQVRHHAASTNELVPSVAIAVIINGNTRGSAEMLAATLRASQRAGLFGAASRGLAIAQSELDMGGSTLRLTEALWMRDYGAAPLDVVSPDVCVDAGGRVQGLGTAVRLHGCAANLPILAPLSSDPAVAATLAFF